MASDRTVDDYVETYRLLRRYARTLPHVTIGLRGGELGHELPAFELLQELGARWAGDPRLYPHAGHPLRRLPAAAAGVRWPISWPRRGCAFPTCPSTWAACGPKGAIATNSTRWPCGQGSMSIVSPSRPARQLAAELGLASPPDPRVLRSVTEAMAVRLSAACHLMLAIEFE